MNTLVAALFTRKPSLWMCVLVDLIGMASFLLPGLSEWTDVVWAPISGYLFLRFLGGAGGMLGGVFSFLEEILPFTDIIPTFTLAWYIQHQFGNSSSNQPHPLPIEDAEIIDIR